MNNHYQMFSVVGCACQTHTCSPTWPLPADHIASPLSPPCIEVDPNSLVVIKYMPNDVTSLFTFALFQWEQSKDSRQSRTIAGAHVNKVKCHYVSCPIKTVQRNILHVNGHIQCQLYTNFTLYELLLQGISILLLWIWVFTPCFSIWIAPKFISSVYRASQNINGDPVYLFASITVIRNITLYLSHGMWVILLFPTTVTTLQTSVGYSHIYYTSQTEAFFIVFISNRLETSMFCCCKCDCIRFVQWRMTEHIRDSILNGHNYITYSVHLYTCTSSYL